MAERRNARCLVNGLSLDHSKLVDIPFQGQYHNPTRSTLALLAKVGRPKKRCKLLNGPDRTMNTWRLNTLDHISEGKMLKEGRGRNADGALAV